MYQCYNTLKKSNTLLTCSASELASFDLIQESSLDWLNGAGDVQCREPQTMLLPGQQAFTNFMDQQAFMMIGQDEGSRRGRLNSTARTISPAQMQLRWSYSLDSSSRRDMVALGNQLWLSVHPAVLLWHPSISEQEARICIAKRERSSDARNGAQAQECASMTYHFIYSRIELFMSTQKEGEFDALFSFRWAREISVIGELLVLLRCPRWHCADLWQQQHCRWWLACC